MRVSRTISIVWPYLNYTGKVRGFRGKYIQEESIKLRFFFINVLISRQPCVYPFNYYKINNESLFQSVVYIIIICAGLARDIIINYH